MPNENLDEWDSDLEHSQENDEDIYTSLTTLDVIRFSHRGVLHNGMVEKVIKDIHGKVSRVTIRLLDGCDIVKTYNVQVWF